MGLWFKFCMLFTSFSPLWISVAFQDIISIIDQKSFVITEIIQLCVLSISMIVTISYLLSTLKIVGKEGGSEYRVQEVRHEKSLASEFLLSYILPMFAFDFIVWTGAAQFLIYFAVLAFLCIRNNHVYTNLILELIGYRFYTCQVQDEKDSDLPPIEIMLIGKKRPSSGDVICVICLNKPFYLNKKS